MRRMNMKTNLISLRVIDEELKTITDNADKMNLSKSEYLRKLALQRTILWKYILPAHRSYHRKLFC